MRLAQPGPRAMVRMHCYAPARNTSRSINFLTVSACQRPPRGVAILRQVSSAGHAAQREDPSPVARAVSALTRRHAVSLPPSSVARKRQRHSSRAACREQWRSPCRLRPGRYGPRFFLCDGGVDMQHERRRLGRRRRSKVAIVVRTRTAGKNSSNSRHRAYHEKQAGKVGLRHGYL